MPNHLGSYPYIGQTVKSIKVNVELNFNYKKANWDKLKDSRVLDQPTKRITITEEIITKDIIDKCITKWMEKNINCSYKNNTES